MAGLLRVREIISEMNGCTLVARVLNRRHESLCYRYWGSLEILSYRFFARNSHFLKFVEFRNITAPCTNLKNCPTGLDRERQEDTFQQVSDRAGAV